MFVASLALISTMACASGPVTGVTIRDADLAVVKELNEAELTEFNQQWRAKIEVETDLKEARGKHFKLDLAQDGSGGRWLYHTTGIIFLVAHNRQPVYRISDPGAFNKLIGADR
jgi:hypothetical protein